MNRAKRHRLIKVAMPERAESVWWTDRYTLDEIAEHGRLVALKRDGQWVCSSGDKWTDADFCAFRFEQLPYWPDEPVFPEDRIADATVKYIKYEPRRPRRGRWFDIEAEILDEDAA
ncbi:MAG: hypothetical protein JSV86_16930 [Gemmatimonadota bacterium]|nr:MAG: hypothetical protein JSV86_16930 [Gemmatimonadota bacterium]